MFQGIEGHCWCVCGPLLTKVQRSATCAVMDCDDLQCILKYYGHDVDGRGG